MPIAHPAAAKQTPVRAEHRSPQLPKGEDCTFCDAVNYDLPAREAFYESVGLNTAYPQWY
jgi:hypothetical protein